MGILIRAKEKIFNVLLITYKATSLKSFLESCGIFYLVCYQHLSH